MMNKVVAMVVVLLAVACGQGDPVCQDGEVAGGHDPATEVVDMSQEQPDGAKETAVELEVDPEACPKGILTTGFSFGWEKLNHRLSRVQLLPSWQACSAEGEGAVTLDAAFVGGDFTTSGAMADDWLFEFDYQLVDSPGNVGFYEGSAAVVLYGPETSAKETISVPASEAHLGGFQEYVAIVRGLELMTDVPQGSDYPDSYDPTLGYTSRGFGVQLTPVEAVEGHLVFGADVHFTHGPSDRPDMNGAIPHAVTVLVVHYTVIGMTGAEVQTGGVAYRQTFPEPEMMVEQVIDHAPAADRAVELVAHPGYPVQAMGWTGFDLVLDPAGEASDEFPYVGYYLRAFSLDAEIVSYSPDEGKTILDMDGYISNASPFIAYYPLDYRFEGAVVFLELPSGSVEEGTVDHAAPSGPIQLPLPSME